MDSVGNLDILYDKPDEAEGAWMAVRGEGAPRDAAQVPYLSDVPSCVTVVAVANQTLVARITRVPYRKAVPTTVGTVKSTVGIPNSKKVFVLGILVFTHYSSRRS